MIQIMLLIAAALVIGGVRRSIASSRYYLALVLFVCGLYELAPLFARVYLSADYDEVLERLVSGVADEWLVEYCAGLIAFFATALLVASMVLLPEKRLRPKTSLHSTRVSLTHFGVLSGVLLFVSGVLSLQSGAGALRMEQYVDGGAKEISSFHFYSAVMLNINALALWHLLFKKRYKLAFFLVGLAMPAIVDLAIGGRRQFFAPIFLILGLNIFIHVDRNRAVKILAVSSVVMLIVFSLIFQQRTTRQNSSVNYELSLKSVVQPQFNEFVAVGSTSLAAFKELRSSNYPLTILGFDSLHHLLAVSPIIKHFGIHDDAANASAERVFARVAPFGALAVLSESLLIFGLFGFVIAGAGVGGLAAIMDRRLSAYIKAKNYGTFSGSLSVLLAGVLVFQYRSGVTAFAVTWFLYYIAFVACFVPTAIAQKVSFRRSIVQKHA